MTGSIDLDPAYIDAYEQDGVVHIPGVFGGDWTSRLYEATLRILKESEGSDDYASGFERNSPKIHVFRYEGRSSITNAIHNDPDFLAWFNDSCAAALVGTVIQTKTLRYFHDTFFIKEKSDERTHTPAHHDIAAYGLAGTQMPSLWIPLTDVGEDDSPLRTVKGSHNWREFKYRPPPSPQDIPLPDGFRERDGIEDRIREKGAEWHTWLCQAGDVLLIHPWTLHESLPHNNPKQMRIGFSTRWMGDDVVWTPNVFAPPELLATSPEAMNPGDPPPDEDYPIIWRA